MCAISISFAWPVPSKVPITISAPAPRVTLRRSVFAPSAFSRASVKSGTFFRPSRSELPDSIITISRKVSINSGFAASAMARSFSSGGPASAGDASAIPRTHKGKLIQYFLMALPPEIIVEANLTTHASRPLQDFEIDLGQPIRIGHRLDRCDAVAGKRDPQRDTQLAAENNRDSHRAVDQRRFGRLRAALEGLRHRLRAADFRQRAQPLRSGIGTNND